MFISEDNLRKIETLLKGVDGSFAVITEINEIIASVYAKNGKLMSEEDKQKVEELWKLYPEKKGKKQAVKKLPKVMGQYGYEQVVRVIERYIKDTEERRKTFPDLHYQNGSTFFNSGYEDYLDENYIDVFAPATKKPPMAAYQVVGEGCCPTCQGEGVVKVNKKWVKCPECGGEH